MAIIYTIVNITPWGNYELPSLFTNKQDAYNYLHELQIRFPNEHYAVKANGK